jgi:anthranilate phosphoribosyltransferase
LLVANGQILPVAVDPAQYGFAYVPVEALKGGDATYNALRLNQLLAGKQDAYRDVVLLNAGVALWLADKVPDIGTGVNLAKSVLTN